MNFNYKSYLTLCKPRVVALMILTSFVGMCLAPKPNNAFTIFIFGNLGIMLIAAAAATLNHIADQHIDKLMQRTLNRPIPKGALSTKQSLLFALILGTLGLFILVFFTNLLTAFLTLLSLIGYAICYTIYLKYMTPQNIVIGGIAGAIPPLLGWTAMTNHISANALLLVLIIYVWTPPHFWALAIYRLQDYANADIPMLPNTHGVSYTKLNILLYTILLTVVTFLPVIIHMSGIIYCIGMIILNVWFLYKVILLYRNENKTYALSAFKVSIYYLMLLFILLLLDYFLS